MVDNVHAIGEGGAQPGVGPVEGVGPSTIRTWSRALFATSEGQLHDWLVKGERLLEETLLEMQIGGRYLVATIQQELVADRVEPRVDSEGVAEPGSVSSSIRCVDLAKIDGTHFELVRPLVLGSIEWRVSKLAERGVIPGDFHSHTVIEFYSDRISGHNHDPFPLRDLFLGER